jgi:hypothetical protein
MRLALILAVVTVAGCEKPMRSYDCLMTRSCPGVDPITVEYLSICGSSPGDAEQEVCKGETCDCSAGCRLVSSDPFFC